MKTMVKALTKGWLLKAERIVGHHGSLVSSLTLKDSSLAMFGKQL